MLHDYHMETSNSLEAMVSKVMYKYLPYGTVPWMKRVAMHTAVVLKASMYYINIATGSSGLLGTLVFQLTSSSLTKIIQSNNLT